MEGVILYLLFGLVYEIDINFTEWYHANESTTIVSSNEIDDDDFIHYVHHH